MTDEQILEIGDAILDMHFDNEAMPIEITISRESKIAFARAVLAACAAKTAQEPVARVDYIEGMCCFEPLNGARLADGQALYANPFASVKMVKTAEVPEEFLREFLRLAHNYSLTAIPPDYYDGRTGDGFKDAYRRCGRELAGLKGMLVAAQEVKP